MKRIDFLGAPGVGKSTLYKQLIDSRGGGSFGLTPKEADLKLAREYLNNIPKKNIKEILAVGTLNNIFLKPLHPIIVDKVIRRVEDESIWAEREQYSEFLNQALLGACVEEKDPVRRLMGANWLFDVIKKVAVVENSKFDDVVLFDESLSQKIYGVTYHDTELDRQEIEMYFNLMPKPLHLVYCYLTPDRVLERLNSRSKVIPSHRGLDETNLLNKITIQMQIAEIGYQVLKSRGINIVELDMQDSINKNAEKLVHLLHNITIPE